MKTNLQIQRHLTARLPAAASRRLVVLTGARQTGKTTLAQAAYPELRYLNLDDPELRAGLREVRASDWRDAVGPAILDEAQKEPGLFEKLKFAFDACAVGFSVLLGSSRILLLDRVKETLAGRSFLYDLWPLMASELWSAPGGELEPPLLDALIQAGRPIGEILAGQPRVLLGAPEEQRRAAVEHLSRWGGMPALLPLSDEERREWLRSYQQTFLERDLADLARLADLQPFSTFQKLAMLRSARLLSYAELARGAGIAATTARNYLEYLRISYQVVLLRPYSRNLTSTVIKAPKLYWMDMGLLRHGTRQHGKLTGELFETLVVAETWKWISTMGRETDLYFYRTRSGLEVDLLLQTAGGVIAFEIKNRDSVVSADLSGLRSLATALGSDWLGGAVVYSGRSLERLDTERNLWSLPVHRLL